jgi:hypothetical protein
MKEADIREQIAEILKNYHMYVEMDNPELDAADQILSIPLPTIKLVCDTCGGKWEADRCGLKGGSKNCPHDFPRCDMDGDCDAIVEEDCPDCKDGEREYRVVWEREWNPDTCPVDFDLSSIPSGSTIESARYSDRLTFYDLADPDVAWTYSWFFHCRGNRPDSPKQKELPNNKGTLRLQEVEG